MKHNVSIVTVASKITLLNNMLTGILLFYY